MFCDLRLKKIIFFLNNQMKREIIKITRKIVQSRVRELKCYKIDRKKNNYFFLEVQKDNKEIFFFM